MEKPLVFAGGYSGHLGIFDGSDTSVIESDDAGEMVAAINTRITTAQLHTKSITSIQFDYNNPNSVFTASYDGTIRKLDLATGESVEVYAPTGSNAAVAITAIEIPQSAPHMLRFATKNGTLVVHDMRTPALEKVPTRVLQLASNKIGGFSSHPLAPHILATASLDRTLKLWDLRLVLRNGSVRSLHSVGQHENRLSVSHASFNQAGQVATSSFDNTVKIYDFQSVADIQTGRMLPEQAMQPKVEIPHNNRTGQWVTM